MDPKILDEASRRVASRWGYGVVAERIVNQMVADSRTLEKFDLATRVFKTDEQLETDRDELAGARAHCLGCVLCATATPWMSSWGWTLSLCRASVCSRRQGVAARPGHGLQPGCCVQPGH